MVTAAPYYEALDYPEATLEEARGKVQERATSAPAIGRLFLMAAAISSGVVIGLVALAPTMWMGQVFGWH